MKLAGVLAVFCVALAVPAGAVAGKIVGTASGEVPIASASGYTRHPLNWVQLRAHSTSGASVTATIDMYCVRGNRTASTERTVGPTPRVNHAIRLPLRRADYCEIGASAKFSDPDQRGKVVVSVQSFHRK